MPQVYQEQLDGNKVVSPVQFTHLNEGLVKSRAIAKGEVIRWKGANNDEVEGILHYPLKYEAGKKNPLITAIHRGPTGTPIGFWDNHRAYPPPFPPHPTALRPPGKLHPPRHPGIKCA